MAVYPKGKKFMASVGTGPQRSRKTFVLEVDAIAWEKLTEAATAVLKALPPPKPAGWTLQQAFDHTAMHQWRGKPGEKKAHLNANQALTFFGPNTLTSAILPADVTRYMTYLIQTRGNANSTLNKKMSALRVMLDNAVDQGGLGEIPRMKRYVEVRIPPRWLTDDDERDMLALCDRLGYSHLHDFIVIGFFTGYRSGELLALRTDDYQNGILLLHEGATKSTEPRAVPCSPAVKVIMERCIAEGQSRVFEGFSKASLRGEWEDMRGQLGRSDDPKFTPHKMRHACATRMVSAGVNLKVVQAWMGHEVIETTMRYAHLDPTVMAQAAAMLMNRVPEYRKEACGTIEPTPR